MSIVTIPVTLFLALNVIHPALAIGVLHNQSSRKHKQISCHRNQIPRNRSQISCQSNQIPRNRNQISCNTLNDLLKIRTSIIGTSKVMGKSGSIKTPGMLRNSQTIKASQGTKTTATKRI